MSYREAARRAFITFLAGATSAPISAELLNVATWKVVIAAGIASLWNYLGRVLQAAKVAFDPPGS